MNLFGKARVVVLGNFHAVLDKIVDLNSIPVVKQYVRDLESARDSISGQAAMAKGRVNTLRTQIASLEQEIKEADGNITLLLTDDDPSNDSMAIPLQVQLGSLQQRLADNREELATHEKTAEAMGGAYQKILARHEEMVRQIRTLEQQDRSAKAKETAADALKKVGNMANVGSGASVDNLAARIQERSATADAVLEQAFGNLGSKTDDSIAVAKAKAAIAARRQALGANKPGNEAAA